jgi:hypothetical protein
MVRIVKPTNHRRRPAPRCIELPDVLNYLLLAVPCRGADHVKGDVYIVELPVLAQVIKMRNDGGGALVHHGFDDTALIVLFGFTTLHRERACRTVADAGPESVAQDLSDQSGLSVDYLQCSLRASRDAFPAPVAEVLVDGDDFSFHGFSKDL